MGVLEEEEEEEENIWSLEGSARQCLICNKLLRAAELTVFFNPTLELSSSPSLLSEQV